jgi:hypothetical protein
MVPIRVGSAKQIRFGHQLSAPDRDASLTTSTFTPTVNDDTPREGGTLGVIEALYNSAYWTALQIADVRMRFDEPSGK